MEPDFTWSLGTISGPQVYPASHRSSPGHFTVGAQMQTARIPIHTQDTHLGEETVTLYDSCFRHARGLSGQQGLWEMPSYRTGQCAHFDL